MSDSNKVLIDWAAFLTGPPAANVSKCAEAKATLLLDVHSELGEGIVYDDQRQEIVWCDILDRKFHRLSCAAGAKLETCTLDKMLGSFALLSANSDDNAKKLDGSYLFAWEDGFQIYNPNTQQAFSEMSTGEDVNSRKLPSRLNDGRCDPSGKRFICGGYFGGNDDVKMKVFCCQLEKGSTNRLIHTPLIDNVFVTNSLAFSPNGKTMYFADSPTAQIVAYDYNVDASDAASLLSNKKVLYTVELEGAVPDGSCVDANGFIWSATWWDGIQASRVRRIDPTSGKVVFEVHMPDGTSQVSCCCFGGPDLDILFITTAGEGRDATKEPHAGGLYAIKLAGVKGKLEHRFQM